MRRVTIGSFIFAVSIIITLGMGIFITPTSSRRTISAQTTSNEWSQVAHDPQRTGQAANAVIPPFSLKWKWMNGQKWDGQTIPQMLTIEIPVLAQPIVGDGKVYLGSFQGKFFAIAESNGQTLWTFQSDLPILHTAAYANKLVYFGSTDGYLYALNTGDGSLVWKYNTGPIYSAPLIVNNAVCIGSKTNYFYCFKLTDQNGDKTGDLIFRYDAKAPFYQTAAASEDSTKIYIGSEDMIPHCLLSIPTSVDGTVCPNWNPFRLPGESLIHYWPVVQGSTVVFTTFPERTTNELFPAVDGFLGTVSGTDWSTVEPALTTYYQSHQYYQSMFFLDSTTGQKKYPTASSHVAYHQDAFVPPIISNGALYNYYRGKTTSFGGSFGTNYAPDIGSFNLGTGKITPLGSSGEFGSMISNDIDDNTAFSSAPGVIYAFHNSRCVAVLDMISRKSSNAGQITANMSASHCGGNSFPSFFTGGGEPGIAGYDNRGEGLMGPALSGNSMYMLFRGGELLAVTGGVR